jgi:hypothetical protein
MSQLDLCAVSAQHVDDGFLAQVTELYRQRIPPGKPPSQKDTSPWGYVGCGMLLKCFEHDLCIGSTSALDMLAMLEDSRAGGVQGCVIYDSVSHLVFHLQWPHAQALLWLA